MLFYKLTDVSKCRKGHHVLKKKKHNQKPHSVENKRRCGLVLDINYYARSSLSILLISRDRINIPITVVSNDSNCMPYFRLLYNQFTAKLAANICYNWNWINGFFKMGFEERDEYIMDYILCILCLPFTSNLSDAKNRPDFDEG